MALPRRSMAWQFGLSAYWFATSMKWFLLLSAVLPGQVEALVPGGEKGTLWGRVVLLGALWALVGPALFGWLSERFPTKYGKWRPWLVLGSATTVGAMLVLARPEQYSIIVLGYVLLQIGDDLAQGPYSSLIPGLVSTEQRGRASGVMGFLQLSAQIVGALAARALGDVVLIYVMLASVNVLCALVTLATVREEIPERERAPENFAEAWVKPWKNHDFRWVWFTRFLNALGFYMVYTYLLFFLSDVVREFRVFEATVADIGGGSPDEIRAAASSAIYVIVLEISLIAGVGALVAGRIADRVGRKRVVYVAGVVMALTLLPVPFFASFTALTLLAVPFAFSYGAYQSADWALASDVMPDTRSLAKDMGLWQSSISAPQILTGLAGMVVDAANAARPGMGYQFTFLFAAVAFGLGSLLITRVRGST
ncbi:MAG: MFS transporter [Armatimonadota bacterium]